MTGRKIDNNSSGLAKRVPLIRNVSLSALIKYEEILST